MQRTQLVGFGASQAAQFPGLEREVIVDTSIWTLRVQDGATPGGFALLSAVQNLNDLPDKGQSRTNLGLKSAALLTSAEVAQVANSLSEFAGSLEDVYSNLELGTAALVDTTAFDAAGAAATVSAASLQKSSNLSDLANAGTSRTNLGLGALAVLSTVNNAQWSGTSLAVANGGTGSTTAPDARTALGLGTSATVDTGTSGATVPLLSGANIWSTTQTFTLAPVFTAAAGTRTALGLGTAAVANTGTSGANVPLMSTANTWALAQTFTTAPVFTNASGTRTALGLGSLAVLNTVNNGNWSGTALAIANGGTGQTSASGAFSALGGGSLGTCDVTFSTSAPSGTGTPEQLWIQYIP